MSLWTPDGALLRKEGEPPPRGGQARPRPAPETAVAPEHAIVCGSCGHAITTEGARIAVGGDHEHRFVNPAGFIFDVVCFRDAPGCEPAGDPTPEFTWFPGFAWQIAYCGECRTHLGWRFESGARDFYGLVKDRIVSVSRRGDD